MADIDEIDLTLIELLQKDARTPQAQLAATVGLAASSVNERIRKLGERGLIAGFHARISPEAMGYDLLAFLYVAWSRPETRCPPFTVMATGCGSAEFIRCEFESGSRISKWKKNPVVS